MKQKKQIWTTAEETALVVVREVEEGRERGHRGENMVWKIAFLCLMSLASKAGWMFLVGGGGGGGGGDGDGKAWEPRQKTEEKIQKMQGSHRQCITKFHGQNFLSGWSKEHCVRSDSIFTQNIFWTVSSHQIFCEEKQLTIFTTGVITFKMPWFFVTLSNWHNSIRPWKLRSTIFLLLHDPCKLWYRYYDTTTIAATTNSIGQFDTSGMLTVLYTVI